MSLCPSCRQALRKALPTLPVTQSATQQRPYSFTVSTVRSVLSKPTWSVRRSLLSTDSVTADATTITPTTLHHLLRLSALPQPSSSEEEASMIGTLRSQLQFVRAVQSVDTTGVVPLTAVRDETRRAVAEGAITLEKLQPALEREHLVGHHRRPRRNKEPRQQIGVGEDGKVEDERWDILGTASKKAGKFFVVQSKKST